MYRGPSGNGVSTERIRTDWNVNPPQLLWRTQLTNGLSSLSVSGGRVFTQVRTGSTTAGAEYCVALDARTGEFLWTAPVGQAKYDYPNNAIAVRDGPRSTPAVAGDRVYVLGSYLNLVCLNATNGQTVWAKDLRAQFGGSVISWQNAASPLIEGDLLLVNCNASPNRLLALRLSNGSVAWRKLDYAMTHATPVPATIHGVRQVIFMTQFGLVSVNPLTGDELWRSAFPYSTSTAASPAVDDDMVYCAAAYSVGSVAVQVTQSGSTLAASALWARRPSRMIHWSTPVVTGGYVYGLYGQDQEGTAPMRCLDLRTGQDRWSQTDFGMGSTLLVDGNILALTDYGDVVLVQPNPAQYRELGRFTAVTGNCWNSPALSDGTLYIRSAAELAAFDVSLPPPPPLRLAATLDQVAGKVIFEVANTDGEPIADSRVAGISLRNSNNVSAPFNDWAPAGVALTLQSGKLRGELELPAGESAVFFAVREN